MQPAAIPWDKTRAGATPEGEVTGTQLERRLGGNTIGGKEQEKKRRNKNTYIARPDFIKSDTVIPAFSIFFLMLHYNTL